MKSEWFFLKEAHSLSGLPNDDIPEYIFWGRSNVGKSSLINLLKLNYPPLFQVI